MKTAEVLVAAALAGAFALSGTSGAFATDPGSTASGGTAVAPEDTEVTIGNEAPTTGVKVQRTKTVSGGTWTYGTKKVTTNAGKQKKCYSYYSHPSRKHSATAIIEDNTIKKVATKGKWAKANAYGKRSSKCYAKWNSEA